jgi:hypothetical protein
MGEIRNVYKILIGKSEEKRLIGRSGHRQKDIKMDLRVTGGRVWIGFICLKTGTGGGLL